MKFTLAERVASMRAWARSRIAHCDAGLEELRSIPDHVAAKGPIHKDRAVIIFRTEKIALEAVLRQLDEEPSDV